MLKIRSNANTKSTGIPQAPAHSIAQCRLFKSEGFEFAEHSTTVPASRHNFEQCETAANPRWRRRWDPDEWSPQLEAVVDDTLPQKNVKEDFKVKAWESSGEFWRLSPRHQLRPLNIEHHYFFNKTCSIPYKYKNI